MQVKELKKDDLNYHVEVTIKAADIDSQVDERLKEVAKTARLPGFRPGKVPLTVLKKRYGQSVMGEALEKAVQESTTKVFEDKGLRPATQPKIEIKTFEEGKDLTYTVEAEIIPSFEVTDYKKFKLEKPVAKVQDKDVDEALQRIADNNVGSKTVETKRAAKEGDIAVINFDGRKADGTEVPGMKGDDFSLKLGSGQFIPGFEEQLVGKKAGDTVEVKVTFPEEYHSPELKGADAVFDVEIKELREADEAKLDDELAKKLGLEDLAALKKAVTEQIENDYAQISRMKVKRNLLDALDDSHEFVVPPTLLEQEFAAIEQQIKAEQGNEEIAEDDKEELKAIAERRVRLGLIMAEIGRVNNVQIDDIELQRAVISEAQKYPGQEAQVFEYFRSNPQALESIRAPLYEEKVVDFVLELATVEEKEVTFEELTAEEDESYLEKKKEGKGKKSTSKKSDDKDAAEKKPAAKKKAATKKDAE